jgi:methylenetetrahydrofolate reductase (NADPH)
VVTQLCDKLRSAGAPGLHFYSMNQSAPSLAVLDRLGL